MANRSIPKPTLVVILAGAALALPVQAQDTDQGAHVLLEPGAFEYQPGPASLDEGSEYSVLYGDPGAEGVFAMRLKLPDGFAIAPHTHPQPEIVTVISGTFLIGTGEEPDREAATRLEPGGFFAFDPGMAHYAFVEGETVIQLNSTGPWQIEYLDPADDPRT